MSESKAMLEIRKIRDENSERHMKMTPEELKKELDETMKWFEERMAKIREESKTA